MNSDYETMSVVDLQANRTLVNNNKEEEFIPYSDDDIKDFYGVDMFKDVDRHAARLAQDHEERTGRLSEHSSELIRRETEHQVRQEYLASQKRNVENTVAVKNYKATQVKLPDDLSIDYRNLGNGTLRIERRIYNVSSYQHLSIIDRTNLPITVKARSAGDVELGLYVELYYHLMPNAVPEDIGFMNTRTFKGVMDSRQKAAYCQMVPGKENTFSLVYFIPDKHLDLENHHLYLEDLDLLVYKPGLAEQPIHPFGSSRDIRDFESAMKYIKDEGFRYTKLVRYNRHDLEDGNPCYLNVDGTVFAIPPVNRLDVPEGITIVENDASTLDSPGHKEPVVRRYSLEDMFKSDGSSFYKRLDDAMALGNFKEKLENTKRKLDLELLDRTTIKEKVKAENEEKMLELKKREMELIDELNVKKAQLKEREQKLAKKAMKAKDKYEKKSLKTKTTSDYLKYAPTIIGGLLTAAGVIYGSGIIKLN